MTTGGELQAAAEAAASLLVVEDDEFICERIVEGFVLDGLRTAGVADLAGARRRLLLGDVDLVLLDVNLPDGSGYDLLRELRSGTLRATDRSLRGLPVIVVSGRAAEQDRLRAFELECDDYVVKPCSFGELRARVKAVLRRSHQPTAADDVIDLGELTIDTRTRSVELVGRAIDLTQKEFRLLCALAGDPQRVHERDDLMERVWGYSGGTRTRTLDAHACRLRSKLSGGARDYVLNCWGVGYRLVAPDVSGEGV